MAIYNITFSRTNTVNTKYGYQKMVTNMGLARRTADGKDTDGFFEMAMWGHDAKVASEWPVGSQLTIEENSFTTRESVNQFTGEVFKHNVLVPKTVHFDKAPTTRVVK